MNIHERMRRPALRILVAGLVMLISACSSSGTAPLPAPQASASLVGVELAPVDPVLSRCSSSRLSATGTFSDGTTRDLTSSALWSSLSPTIASVDASGLVRPHDSGEAIITASSGTFLAQVKVQVLPAPAAPAADPGSPFGIFGPYISITAENPLASVTRSDINACLNDIGVQWAQEQPDSADGQDSIAALSSSGLHVYSRLGALGSGLPPYTVSAPYRDKIRSTIRTYKDTVKYWEFGTEPNGIAPPLGWKDHGREYGEDIKAVHAILKEECPDCSLVFGGLGGIGTGATETSEPMLFLDDALSAGSGTYFEVFEFKQHAAGADDYRELGNRYGIYKQIFSRYGLDLDQRPVFVETATHDGLPAFPPGLADQTEARQAEGLVKYHLYALSQGIDRIFWNLMHERHNFGPFPDGSFDHYGLIHNPDNDGRAWNKLAYYAYKKMAEILAGSDWNSVVTVQDADDVTILRFQRNGTQVYAVWWDYFRDAAFMPGKTVAVSLTGLPGTTAALTEAVPSAAGGDAIGDHTMAFRKETITIQDGSITFSAGTSPLYIEVAP